MIHLDFEDALLIAERVIGSSPRVRDAGLLNAALERPRTTVMGRPAYADVVECGAALVQSLVVNHPLVDGNKRLALGALIAMLGINGHRLDMTNDEAYWLIMAIASGEIREVTDIAARIRPCVRPG